MSKSSGNFFTVRDLLDRGIPGEVIRFVLLSTHYTQPLDWSARKLEEATATLRRWRALAEGVAPSPSAASTVVEALAQDLNTPRAIAELHELAADPAALLGAATMLGLLAPALAGWERAPELAPAVRARIEALLRARIAARAARDFGRADALRDALAAAGVEVKDTPAGSDWSLTPRFDAARLERVH
jgi:cysteinyl-tRNA synthetase